MDRGSSKNRKMMKKKRVPGMPTRTVDSVKDPRFTEILNNPVYRPVPKKEKKIEIDKRFQGMFTDDKFKLKYKVDKRGKPVATATDENMKRYYNLEVDEEDKEADENEDEEDDSDGDDESTSEVEGDVKEEDIKSAVQDNKKKLDKMTRKKLHSEEVDYARGEADLEDVSSSDGEDSSASEGEEEVNMVEHDWGELDKDADRTEESTRRLALCNMDWDRVRAVDLMVLLNSFLPPGGMVTEVAIYPSQFGKERMAEEEREGPKELRSSEYPLVKKEEMDESDQSDGGEGEDDDDDDDDEDEEGEGTRYHREKLRQYQLNRLRYYYAVVEFDSVKTAEKVYAECDGMEYESSAAKVDLRFIPDDTSFEEDTPKEICREMPSGDKYRPRYFTTTALQQVKVDLTWDETDPLRKELTEKIFDPKEKVEDDDIRAFLATSSEEEEEDEVQADGLKKEEDEEDQPVGNKKHDAISKYKALLETIDGEEQKRKREKEDVGMEITWGVGLKETTEKLVKKKLEEEEKKKRTPWEEMLDKRKEKRQKRKLEKKKGEKGEDGEEDDGDSEGEEEQQPFSDDEVDVNMDDEFFRSELRENEVFKEGGPPKKKKKGKGGDVEKNGDLEMISMKKKQDAELALLLMDDDDVGGKRHFSLKKILEEESSSKKSKRQKRKEKMKKKKMGDGGVEEGGKQKDDFEIDVEDQRFSALFKSHHFNVDPSDPNFKKTKAMGRIIEEKQKRRKVADGESGGLGQPETKQKNASDNPLPPQAKKMIDGSSSSSGDLSRKAELSYLVKSIKRNTKNLKMIKKNKNTGKFSKNT